jgi:hypothetical protein
MSISAVFTFLPLFNNLPADVINADHVSAIINDETIMQQAASAVGGLLQRKLVWI